MTHSGGSHRSQPLAKTFLRKRSLSQQPCVGIRYGGAYQYQCTSTVFFKKPAIFVEAIHMHANNHNTNPNTERYRWWEFINGKDHVIYIQSKNNSTNNYWASAIYRVLDRAREWARWINQNILSSRNFQSKASAHK